MDLENNLVQKSLDLSTQSIQYQLGKFQQDFDIKNKINFKSPTSTQYIGLQNNEKENK